jgi:hypothetical protein
MLYGRREERARSAALLDRVGTRHDGVLALAVLTMLVWPASAATSTTIHALVRPPAPATSSPGHQRELGTHRLVSRLLLARGEGRRGHHLQSLGVMVGELDADRMVAASWPRFTLGRGGQGGAAFGARAPPAASRLI